MVYLSIMTENAYPNVRKYISPENLLPSGNAFDLNDPFKIVWSVEERTDPLWGDYDTIFFLIGREKFKKVSFPATKYHGICYYIKTLDYGLPLNKDFYACFFTKNKIDSIDCLTCINAIPEVEYPHGLKFPHYAKVSELPKIENEETGLRILSNLEIAQLHGYSTEHYCPIPFPLIKDIERAFAEIKEKTK